MLSVLANYIFDLMNVYKEFQLQSLFCNADLKEMKVWLSNYQNRNLKCHLPKMSINMLSFSLCARARVRASVVCVCVCVCVTCRYAVL